MFHILDMAAIVDGLATAVMVFGPELSLNML